MDLPKIEKDIPLPPRGTLAYGYGDRLAFIRKMAPGDSFLVQTEKDRNLWVAHCKRWGLNMASRKIAGEGYRIWKVA